MLFSFYCFAFLFQYVCVKFLEPRHESAGKIGIAGIKLFGFTRKSVLVEEEMNVRI